MRQPSDLWNVQPRSRRCPVDCTCGKHARLASKPGYKGTEAEKHARHRRVHIRRGKASEYPCVKCAENEVSKAAREWAQVHGTSGEDPWADYVPLCRRCHFHYDGLMLGGDTSMFKKDRS